MYKILFKSVLYALNIKRIMDIFSIATSFCLVTVTTAEKSVIRVELSENMYPEKSKEIKDIELYEKCVKEFSEYFSGARKEFTLPYAYSLPPFYSKVLKEIAKVPYGQLISYKNLSSKAGNIKAVRACGRACHCNPLPLIIPCHRVTASNGIGGYAYGTEVKRKLLEIEGIKIPDEKQ